MIAMIKEAELLEIQPTISVAFTAVIAKDLRRVLKPRVPSGPIGSRSSEPLQLPRRVVIAIVGLISVGLAGNGDVQLKKPGLSSAEPRRSGRAALCCGWRGCSGVSRIF